MSEALQRLHESRLLGEHAIANISYCDIYQGRNFAFNVQSLSISEFAAPNGMIEMCGDGTFVAIGWDGRIAAGRAANKAAVHGPK